MVWKMKRCLVACLIISALCAIQASAASPYDGNISTTYLTIFRDVVADLSPADDYVFYRSDEYEYTLVAGDLEYNGSSFSLDGHIGKAGFLVTCRKVQSAAGCSSTNINHFSVTVDLTALACSILEHSNSLIVGVGLGDHNVISLQNDLERTKGSGIEGNGAGSSIENRVIDLADSDSAVSKGTCQFESGHLHLITRKGTQVRFQEDGLENR